MLNWLFKKVRPIETPEPPERDLKSLFSTHAGDDHRDKPKRTTAEVVGTLLEIMASKRPVGQDADGNAVAMDDADFVNAGAYSYGGGSNLPDTLLGWYANQSFIGWQMCSILAQNWLIDKACSMPAADAIRNWFTIKSEDGDLSPADIKKLKKIDKRMMLAENMEEFVRMGRIFGIRIAFFKIDGVEDDYYEKPFNIDGIKPNSYRGIVQVDPYWTAPILDQESSSQPDSQHFYEPTWWMINGKRYHRSHLIIFRNSELTDILKPSYLYGGVPLPQRILERIYAAERTANEAPLLAMTKRMTAMKVDIAEAYADKQAFDQRVAQWISMRDNQQIKILDHDDELQQFDVALGDLDAIIMTQYQIVAAIAETPAIKLMGTEPKGFGSQGTYGEKSYHETLESLQTHKLQPMVERHHEISIRSEMPELKGKEILAVWNPLSSPTALEKAQINLAKAQAGAALVTSGAIDAYDERERLISDPDSGYTNLDPVERQQHIDLEPEPEPTAQNAK